MDKIYLNGMQFFAFHGVMQEEKNIGQKYIVSVKLYLNLKNAGYSDNIEDTVDYSLIYKNIKKIVESEKYDLLEKLAQEIANSILKYSLIQKVKVKIEKPSVPIGGIVKNAAVEIARKKDN